MAQTNTKLLVIDGCLLYWPTLCQCNFWQNKVTFSSQLAPPSLFSVVWR